MGIEIGSVVGSIGFKRQKMRVTRSWGGKKGVLAQVSLPLDHILLDKDATKDLIRLLIESIDTGD